VDGLWDALAFLKPFRVLARIVGVVWILGGVVFLVSAFVAAEHRLLYAGIGVLLLIAGAALGRLHTSIRYEVRYAVV